MPDGSQDTPAGNEALPPLPVVLPVAERPTCQWCGKTLRPHYHTEKEHGPVKWRRLRPDEMQEGDDPRDLEGKPLDTVYFYDITKPNDEAYHYPKYRRGCWRIQYTSERVVARIFRGTYGYAGLFCAAGCASAWAVHNCRRLQERKTLRWAERLVSASFNEREE